MPPVSAMPGARTFVLRGALALAAAAAALVLGEVAARWLAPARRVFDLRGLHEFRPDRSWLYGLRPGAEGRLSDTGDVLYRINEDGFRGPRHARPKPPGVFRVVVMGDSIAFGYAVEEARSFPRVLEARLADLVPAARVEVVNLGVGGYNAWNEAELLRDVGLGYEPDLVLAQFCINDLNDPSAHFDAQTRLELSAIPDEAFPDPALRRAPRRPPSPWLGACARSRLCEIARDLWLAARESEVDDAMKRAAVQPVSADDRPEWRWLEARYREMAATAGGAGARFAVLAFPYRAQLAGREPHPVQRRVLELAARHGWDAVDPLDDFRRARAEGARLFIDWWHPTPEGHRLAAEAALRELACRDALGDEARGACPAAADARPRRE
jgi:lysophospholipase L1-like esterase